jgi:superfamily II DNA or RNA helicase
MDGPLVVSVNSVPVDDEKTELDNIMDLDSVTDDSLIVSTAPTNEPAPANEPAPENPAEPDAATPGLPPRNNTDYPLALTKFLQGVQASDTDILQYHQKVTKEFFKDPNNRGLTVMHGTGRGKTMLATAVGDALKDLREIVVLSAKSLRHNFIKEIEKYMGLQGHSRQDAAKTIKNNYKFISSNAGNMLQQLARVGRSVEEIEFEKGLGMVAEKIDLEGKLLIIDEAQNFFNGIVNGSKNAVGLYRAIMDATDIKLVFLSATPITNDPFEIVPMFNMLHGSSLLPDDYDEFHEMYIDKERATVKNREKLKNRIFGLLSYMGDWWQTGGVVKSDETVKREGFPDQLPTIVEYIPMSTQQFASYSNARDLESQVKSKRTVTKESMQKPKTSPGSTYRVASRQISNFLLPDTIKVKKLHSYGFTKHIDRLTDEHLKDLDTYSPKMKKIYENTQKHEGLCVVYSSFVSGEGLRIFSKVLEANNWKEFRPHQRKKPGEKTFVFITGQVSAEDRADILKAFNSKRNQYGADIDLLLLSGAGAEGLDLRNVNSIHVMEPYWNYGRIEQIIARAIRYRSHDDYPEDKRKVQPYIYLSDYPTTYEFKPSAGQKKRGVTAPEKTTDVHLYTKSIKLKMLIDRVYAVMMEASIDCSIHVKNAPANVQKKIDCVMCTPTHQQLFHPNYATDMKTKNPCTRPKQDTVKVKEIKYKDKTYYYRREGSDLAIYEFDESLGAYTELSRNHPHYEDLVEKLLV